MNSRKSLTKKKKKRKQTNKKPTAKSRGTVFP